ncbi:hypothetical protein K3495_g669 [Podosphaera aphanis]|nr:hypothetical protein K3495_g669 [Podosphaera aphanis]
MYGCTNGSITLPRDFRFRYEDGFSTPKSNKKIELKQPSPPRQRLRIRRRVVSSLQAPTDQFLASVAAADVPLPTIEVPQILPSIIMPDKMAEFNTEPHIKTRDRLPKTPVPNLSVDTGMVRKPDWYGSTSSEDAVYRPSSSYSDDSDISYESFDSSRRDKSLYESDDGDCTSPEPDCSDPYYFPAVNQVKVSDDKSTAQVKVTTTKLRSRKMLRYDPPWSKAQILHLWSIYLVYLQDPTLTPLRIGTSRVPPEGVCYRVAREARRSWKAPQSFGPQASPCELFFRNKDKHSASFEKRPLVYAQWPHSSSATRSKLRDLCRRKDQNYTYRYQHYFQSFGTTPFSKSPPSKFTSESAAVESKEINMDIHDIAMSLSLSTALCMNFDGPLKKKLAEEAPTDFHLTSLGIPANSSQLRCITQNRSRRLGSPFSRSYGPSSSRVHERPAISYTGSLGSPLKFGQTRSLSGIQKRRAQLALNEEFNPNSTFNENFYGGQLNSSHRVRTRGLSLVGQKEINSKAFSSLSTVPPQFDLNQACKSSLFVVDTIDRPRLRSPFMESGTRNTFPRRLFPDERKHLPS